MPTQSFSQVITLAMPNRKTENLIVLLGSILHCENILSTGSIGTCIDDLPANLPVLMFIDHSISRTEMSAAIKEARSKNPKISVILLLSHPQPDHFFEDLNPDGIIYDGFSPGSLLALVAGFQPKMI